MQAKTNAEKQRDFRARMKAAGFKEVRGLFAKPQHHQLIRDLVEGLNKLEKKD